MPDHSQRGKSITVAGGRSINSRSESLALRGLEELAAIPPAAGSHESALAVLHAAALSGDVTLGQLVSAHPDLVDEVDGYGLTPLHYAAYAGQVEIVERLLASGADPNRIDSWGNSPLFYAVKEGGAYCVRVLLGAGAQPNLKNDCGETPLERSVSCRKVPMPRELYEIDPEKSTQRTLFAPFYEREWRGGDATVVLELVAGGAELSAEEAAFLGHCKRVVARPDWPHLRRGPSSDEERAAWKELGFSGGQFQMKEMKWCILPHQLLHQAASMGHVGAMAYLLVEGGVPPDCWVNGAADQHRRTPLHIAGTSAAMLLLIKAGADVNARDSNGETPFLALWFDVTRVKGDLVPPLEPPESLARFLVNHGADPSARANDPEYATPVHLWWSLSDTVAREVTQHLLELGFDPNPQSEREPPIVVLLARQMETELLKMAVECGADPEVRDKWGSTAMHYVQSGLPWAQETVEFLQRHGVELDPLE